MEKAPMQQHSNVILFAALILGILLISACSLLSTRVPNLPAPPAASGPLSPVPNQTPTPRGTPLPRVGQASVNYTAADVDRAEALWRSKHVDTYQIEVWAGAITPPAPVYVVQVWQNQVVFAAADRRWAGGMPKFQLLDPAAPQVRAVTVPGLFAKARELLADARTPIAVDVKTRAQFDEEWGFPKQLHRSVDCPDCIWSSDVQRFVVFDPAAPPPTPTPFVTSSPP